jgi:hypothetical protein
MISFGDGRETSVRLAYHAPGKFVAPMSQPIPDDPKQ